MSTKGKRAGTATPQPPQPGGTSTPLISAAASNRSASPLSPTRQSRLQEKVELQNLNDRLACYIDRVRNLETENARLSMEVHSTRETVTREATSIKSMYENELGDARRLLDETAREKARLEIDTKRMWEELEELKAELDKKSKECSIAESNARMYESRATDLSAKYNSVLADRNKISDDLKELQKQNDRLRKQLDEARKQLEEETLARVDLENNIQSLREELSFKDQVHSQEINETRSRRQVEISEIDGRLCEQYEAKLQQSLQELREQYEAQMAANRDEIKMLYENKIKNLQSAANRNSSTTTGVLEELRNSRTRVESLNSRINELEATNNALNLRIKDLEAQLDQERVRHHEGMAALEAEIQRMREEMAHQLQEYQDLMDIKVSLDLEIAAYDKLLCGEESRLNITPSVGQTAETSSFSQSLRATRATPMRKTPSRPGSSMGPLKRKRTAIDETEDVSQYDYFTNGSAKGDIQIEEVDAEGKFVKLFNKGTKEVQIGGWQLVRTAGANVTTFKFHRSVKIDAGGNVTVWSSDSGVAHEPPANIVMKTQKWFASDEMSTKLLNGEGVEVADQHRVKRITMTHTSRHRVGGRASVSAVDGEHIYHSNGELDKGQEKCTVM